MLEAKSPCTGGLQGEDLVEFDKLDCTNEEMGRIKDNAEFLP